MKTTIFTLLLCAFSLLTNAQTIYHDASQFPLLGKISDATETRYERLPARLKNVSRDPVWSLGKNTASLAIRFCSNSPQLSVRWESLNNSVMNHMAPTGIKGLDLYCLEKDRWVYVNTARPTEKKSETVIAENMEKKEREFMLYLPLYDGVVSIEIGIDASSFIGQPKVDLPQRKKPVVAYGTSITQGGCASRTGMAHINILSRWLNREFINLGFSGSGLLDYEIAELMTECDASVYTIEFGNCTTEQILEKTEKFYRILREKHPNTPIAFLEISFFPASEYNLTKRNDFDERNVAIRQIFNQLKAKKDKNLWLFPSAGQLGTDGEGTVDGTHPTDLGFLRYAEYQYPRIKKIIK